MKAAIILTAREASSRLPGKILKQVAGKTALDICLARLKKVGIPVILAVPSNEKDKFAYYAKKHKAALMHGDPESPLHRIAGILKQLSKVTHFVRVTADDILIDAQTVKDMLAKVKANPAIGYMNCPGIMEGAGVEIISRENLLRAAENNGPTEFISYFVRGEKMPLPTSITHSPRAAITRPYRLTMDYPADWQLIHVVLSALGADASCDKICRYLDHHPELLNINRLPVISIYTCARNAEKTIGKTIASVLALNGRIFEYIIVDDGSTDGTVAEISKFVSDPRIRLIVNEDNKGLASSSNVAIAAARGRYIMRVDADDMLIPENFTEALPQMITAIDAGAVAVYPAYFEIGDSISSTLYQGDANHHAGCALMLKSAINEFRFREGLRHWDGLELFNRISKKADSVAYYLKPTWFYRISGGSMSRANGRERAGLLITLGLEGIKAHA